MQTIIAFDVSMGKSYMVIYQNGQCVEEKEIQHNKKDFQALHVTIQSLFMRYGQYPEIVFEATGVYSKVLESFMQANQYPYYLLNPLEAKQQCDRLRVHKTDRSDAHRLAQTHLTSNRKPKVFERTEYQQLRVLSRFYEEIDKEIILIKNRLHNALQLTFPELASIFPNQNSALYLNVLLLFPHPELVLSCSRTVLKNKLLANTKKNLSSERALKKAEELVSIASSSYPAVTLEDVTVSKVRYYAEKISHLLCKKQEIIEEMEALASPLPEYDILRQIPGIGSSSAVRFIAEAGDVRRFTTSRELNAYAGIDIRRYQSGKTFYSDHINKRGNPKLRKLLYLMIQNMLKNQQNTPNHIVHYYYKQKEEPYNKCHKVASVACINKLLKTIHYLTKTNQMYDYSLATTS